MTVAARAEDAKLGDSILASQVEALPQPDKVGPFFSQQMQRTVVLWRGMEFVRLDDPNWYERHR